MLQLPYKHDARLGLRLLFLNREFVVEKSKEQLQYIMACIQCQNDVTVILPTGGGKSTGWQVLAKLNRQCISVIITPYTLLLEDQIQSTKDRGIFAEKFMATSGRLQDPENVQLVFVQPETAKTNAFKE